MCSFGSWRFFFYLTAFVAGLVSLFDVSRNFNRKKIEIILSCLGFTLALVSTLNRDPGSGTTGSVGGSIHFR